MEEIEKLEDGIVKVVYTNQVVEYIDIPSCEAELDSLENEDAPSDEELLIHAKAGVTHPYYSAERLSRISELKNLIEKYK